MFQKYIEVYYVAVNVYKHSNLPLGIANIQAHLQHITFIIGSSAIQRPNVSKYKELCVHVHYKFMPKK
jgi:hypothetical protein